MRLDHLPELQQMSSPQPSFQRHMSMFNERDLANEPELAYYDPYMTVAPSQLSFNSIHFPSNVNGYPIARSTQPSHGKSHNPVALCTLPDVGSLGGLSQGHVYPTSQGHQNANSLEKSTWLVTRSPNSAFQSIPLITRI